VDDPAGEPQGPITGAARATVSAEAGAGPAAGTGAGAAVRGRMADTVYQALLSQLMSLRLVPGARVTIDALVRDLGVSQTPIRDALSRLEADGLVVRVPNAGYRIPPKITKARYEDMTEIRLILEPVVARKSAERASPGQVSGLRAILSEMAGLVNGSSQATYGDFGLRDAAFHDLVAQSAGNEIIREALTRLHTHVHLFRLVFDTQVTAQAMIEHAQIVDAIANREPEAASYAMRRHILLSVDRFRRLFPTEPEPETEPDSGSGLDNGERTREPEGADQS
jgi:DNA-binding GntR family transcriptional regulator